MGRRYGRPTTLVPHGGERIECHSLDAGDTTSQTGRFGHCTNGTLRIAGPIGGLSKPVQEDSPKEREDPSIFTIDLETLAVKAFGDMGPKARLRLIRDRFIAGNYNCALRRHLDSVPPEIPIQDIVDRCRVWKSHADMDGRRIVKLTPERARLVYT